MPGSTPAPTRRFWTPATSSFEQGWITKDDLLEAAKPLGKNAYGAYLRQIAGEVE